jgi:hypothetical protein
VKANVGYELAHKEMIRKTATQGGEGSEQNKDDSLTPRYVQGMRVFP